MTYETFLAELSEHAEESLARFHEPIIASKSQKILGVRVAVLRKIAKANVANVEELLTYPDDFHEVTMVKLLTVSCLPYERFTMYVRRAVGLISNWMQCDCFKAACIAKYKRDFLPYIDEFFRYGEEFFQRYALVMLLYYYVDEEYFDDIFFYLSNADTKKYYVYMAAAWLVAELLIQKYEFGLRVLQSGVLDGKTHDKAIQKARESFRVSKERKEFLNSLKINKNR